MNCMNHAQWGEIPETHKGWQLEGILSTIEVNFPSDEDNGTRDDGDESDARHSSRRFGLGLTSGEIAHSRESVGNG